MLWYHNSTQILFNYSSLSAAINFLRCHCRRRFRRFRLHLLHHLGQLLLHAILLLHGQKLRQYPRNYVLILHGLPRLIHQLLHILDRSNLPLYSFQCLLALAYTVDDLGFDLGKFNLLYHLLQVIELSSGSFVQLFLIFPFLETDFCAIASIYGDESWGELEFAVHAHLELFLVLLDLVPGEFDVQDGLIVIGGNFLLIFRLIVIIVAVVVVTTAKEFGEEVAHCCWW